MGCGLVGWVVVTFDPWAGQVGKVVGEMCLGNAGAVLDKGVIEPLIMSPDGRDDQ